MIKVVDAMNKYRSGEVTLDDIFTSKLCQDVVQDPSKWIKLSTEEKLKFNLLELNIIRFTVDLFTGGFVRRPKKAIILEIDTKLKEVNMG